VYFFVENEIFFGLFFLKKNVNLSVLLIDGNCCVLLHMETVCLKRGIWGKDEFIK
jgi:hypothetical protein